MFVSAVCTGDQNQIRNAMESFPSGRAQISFAGLLYLSIYLNAHLGVFTIPADFWIRRRRYWKMLAVLAPTLLAFHLALTLVMTHYHQWHDVVFGGLLGSFMAVSSYKMVFVSLWGAGNYATYDMMVKSEHDFLNDEDEETEYLSARAGIDILPSSHGEATHNP
jgi:ATP/ADP translocase